MSLLNGELDTILQLSNKMFSIKWRFVLIFLIVAAVAFAAVAYSVIKMSEDYLLSQRVEESLEEASGAAVSVVSTVISDDSDGMYNLVLTRAKNTGGRYLIVNKAGTVIADSQSKLNGQILYLDEVEKVLSNGEVNAYSYHNIDGEWAVYYVNEITDEGSLIGAMVYQSSIQTLINSMNDLTVKIIVISIACCLIVIVLSIITSDYITRPIIKLKKAAIDISTGNFNQRVKVSGRDEIAELAQAFNEMTKRLEDIDITRSEFVSNASHELRTPLSSIKILVESLIYQQDVPKETYDEFLTDINKEIDRLNNIISDLLNIMKLEGEEVLVCKENVSLKDILLDTMNLLKPLADQQRIHITLDADEDVLIECDPLKIHQAVNNLADNAIKYTNTGGLITIRLKRLNDFAVIEVEDTGVGISQEDMQLIFERFYRVDKARSRKTGGTGLGLYIAKKIAIMHGGSLDVVSEEGKGSAFILSIPVKHTKIKSKAEEEASKAKNVVKGKVFKRKSLRIKK
ncbi:MAG: ATP-binding protein [Eubacteriales bacterium]